MNEREFERLWSMDWKELARRAGQPMADSPNWVAADAVVKARLALEQRAAADAATATARATRWLAWMTGALAVATVAIGLL